MSTTSVTIKAPRAVTWTDTRLVQECLKGNESAWSALIDKYKNLIYSIPIKHGLGRDEAADIFQSVCVDLLSQLSKLREPRALPKWIIQITAHKTYRWKRLQARSVPFDEPEEPSLPDTHSPTAEGILREAEQEQMIREAIAALPPRCGQLVHMLFFEHPPVPYAEVANRLRIATGSIGFIRGRCLNKLRKQLEALTPRDL